MCPCGPATWCDGLTQDKERSLAHPLTKSDSQGVHSLSLPVDLSSLILGTFTWTVKVALLTLFKIKQDMNKIEFVPCKTSVPSRVPLECRKHDKVPSRKNVVKSRAGYC